MSACEKCRLREQCFERRGRCSIFETEKQYRKRLKHDIEMLNKTEVAGSESEDRDENREE